jgi:Branched-chain amino acid aminotransferase/4-amino-4-deoxychorismate lyase
LARLKFEIPGLFTVDKLREDILRVCQKNACLKLARVRLSVYRGNGGLYDQDRTPGYTIEAWPLDPSMNELNNNGLVIGICPGLAKSCDTLANLKSASAQIYSMAALYASEMKWNDALVLNTGERSRMPRSRTYFIKDGIIHTPGLDQGCVAGVMRKYLLGKLREANYRVEEKPVSPTDW